MSQPCLNIILDQNSFTIDHIKHGFFILHMPPNQSILPRNVELCNKSLLLCGGASFGVKSFDYGMREPALMENDILIPLHPSMLSNYQKFVCSATVNDLLQCHDVANVKFGELLSNRKSERSYLENQIRNLQLLSNGIRINTDPAINSPNAPVIQFKEVVAYTMRDLRTIHDEAVKSAIKIYHDQSFEETLRRQLSLCIEETGKKFKRLTIAMRHGILRIPESFKLHIQELEVSDNANELINSIKNIIDDKSFPLKLLIFQTTMADDPVFQNDILRTSKTLKIIAHGQVTGNWAAVLIHLPQKEVLFVTEQVTCQFVADIANSLIDNPRELYNLYIQCHHVGDVMTSLKPLIKSVSDELIRYPDFPPIIGSRIGTSSIMLIHGGPSFDHEKELNKLDGKPWMISIQTRPVDEIVRHRCKH